MRQPRMNRPHATAGRPLPEARSGRRMLSGRHLDRRRTVVGYSAARNPCSDSASSLERHRKPARYGGADSPQTVGYCYPGRYRRRLGVAPAPPLLPLPPGVSRAGIPMGLLNPGHRPKAVHRTGTSRIPRPRKNTGKETANTEWGMIDKDSIQTLIGMLALSAPPAREAGGATGTLAIAARVPLTALTIFKMREAILSCSASN
jgi:hypothetical protein